MRQHEGSEETERADGEGASLPSVYLLGGEKCGSTSLAFALSRHPQIQLARHALPGEPAFYRKEIHFFDDDLRYARGLGFYAAHFPHCDRPAHATAARYWSRPPRTTVEVLLEDAASGAPVGWDAELNVPGDVARTVMLVPATSAAEAGEAWYYLIDSASSQLLYNRDWLLRTAPLHGAERVPSTRQHVHQLRDWKAPYATKRPHPCARRRS